MTVDKSKKIWEQITERTWCQGAMSDGFGCCALKWLELIYGFSMGDEYDKLRSLIPSERGVGAWNDTHTFPEVHAALKQADL